METEGEHAVKKTKRESSKHTHTVMGKEQDGNSKRLQRGRWQADR